jgi:Cys-rich protein (TIGR01571 family)|mmetsp:Transcript_46730/g.141611  ORF Transcript_46730/g.141611 Transcript_46730/m.141611 type:complete len:304 (-) Transcript_46730:238-1149(-)|eukprot:CAMPEP_0113559924 /NCGR_PEP_ID=MMETSP0015_2-20120614/19157_1 /TAXON_ID=2838 /ORGANISM="Odontella" /LENGTH=303 /DNA_ID=CAMNT_0000461595 /DNA_START=226 /DNA_END=1137 /DNA_ORIENTATION=+ /assembly_acc=CAM_ASM_000160
MSASGEETRRLVDPPIATVVAASDVAGPLKGETIAETPTSEQLLEVVSPGTLPGGYGFDAVFAGQVFTAIVPPEGVVKGQSFTVTFSPGITSSSAALPPPGVGAPNYPPRGRFRDELCSCCSQGPCHPSVLNALCCPQILTAQVMTRMHLNWLGGSTSEATNEPWKRTFKKVALIVAVYYIAATILEPYVKPTYETNAAGDLVRLDPVGPQSLVILNQVLASVFGLYTLFILARTRRAVREAYAIPAKSSCSGGGCIEDVCCSLCCGCCTAAQLARHTADYRNSKAVCCSGTGLPKLDPVLIV